jgi:sigma-B regulation protein RsbU (phosphoserine phosphatase)
VSKDEVGRLTRNFNIMARQLKERLRLKEEISLAMEVQQNLLPAGDYAASHLEISGTVIYCDETGGDFFDIIELDHTKEKVCVVVGDVVGHGIGAALLMTTTRALLRSCLHQGLSLAQCITHANRLLCLDTAESGSFVTLFAMIVHTGKQDIEWVRAGHDPAICYDTQKEKITELKGQGVVLGLDDTFEYSSCKRSGLKKESSIVIGTDGVWEVENPEHERFGKNRIKKLISTGRNRRAKDLLDLLVNEIERFKNGARQEDDITLVVLKFR